MEKTLSPSYRGGGDDTPDPLIPEDLLIQILVQLPIKSLLRFKSVCKSWRDLIQTSFFTHLHITFNYSTSSSSNFGTFILRTDNNIRGEHHEILMLSEYEGGSESEYYGDQYRCTDGTWHRFSTDGDGDWLWNDTNHPLWYDANHPIWYIWKRVGQNLFKHDQEDWLWDDTKHRWYLVGDDLMDKYHLIHKYHQENLLWDDTNGRWYWVRDHKTGLLWDDTNGRWYWVHGDGDGGGDEEEEEDHEVFKAANDDDDDQLLLKVDKLELPSCYKLTSGRVIAGSCNGLVCLYDQKLRDVSLWNPTTTNQFRILPKSITIEIDDDDSVKHSWDFVAFGFDVTTKDYKVLLITYFITSKSRAQWRPESLSRAQVYCLSTDSWREINSPLGPPAAGRHGLYLNGSCFFIARVYHPESNKFINSFDFSKETFTTMQLPDHDHRKRFFLRYLGGEKMALFTTLRKRRTDEYDSDDSNDSLGYEDCDNWVLNEPHSASGDSLNKEESWTKLHSFQIRNNKDGQPIGMSNNGKFAFLDTTDNSYGRRIQLYNLATKEVKLDIPFCVGQSIVYVYKPSLVSISSPAIR